MHSTARRRIVAAAALTLGLSGAGLVASTSPSSANKPLARATLLDASGVEVGEVVFKGPGRYADRVEVQLEASAAPNRGDFHGFHIHTTGVCTAPFTSAGGHWNPGGVDHGDHKGDLPSVLMTAEGETYAEFETERFQLAELFDGDGSAVILHAGPDNFANIPAAYGTPNATTLGTGDAGGRYACGVVEAL
jgi:Cu-Zn family superoxide dismutase